jgi:hypothetical protein
MPPCEASSSHRPKLFLLGSTWLPSSSVGACGRNAPEAMPSSLILPRRLCRGAFILAPNPSAKAPRHKPPKPRTMPHTARVAYVGVLSLSVAHRSSFCLPLAAPTDQDAQRNALCSLSCWLLPFPPFDLSPLRPWHGVGFTGIMAKSSWLQ